MEYSKEYKPPDYTMTSKPKKKNRRQGKKKTKASQDINTYCLGPVEKKQYTTSVLLPPMERKEHITNPFLIAIEKPSMALNYKLSLPRPKKVLKDLSILGIDDDLSLEFVENIVWYKTLDKYCQKFREIQALFPSSLRILKVQQVFNPFLRLHFQLKRYFAYSNVKPLKLFHGTKLKYIHSICTYNFDWRFNGTEKGHRYGQGVNFTPKPKFAMNFCEKNVDVKVVILADVLVIKKGVGHENLQVPPKNCDTTIRENNSVYVKFYDAEFYPGYVIFFQKVEKPK